MVDGCAVCYVVCFVVNKCTKICDISTSYTCCNVMLNVRSCCALIGFSGTQTQTCLVTSAAQRQVVESCFCSGTCTKHLSYWHLWPVKRLLSWRMLATTSSLDDQLPSWRAFLATLPYHRYRWLLAFIVLSFVIFYMTALCRIQYCSEVYSTNIVKQSSSSLLSLSMN